MAGGLGDDIYVVDSAGDVVTEAAGAGNDRVDTTMGTYSLAGLANVEELHFMGTGDFSGTGNALSNVMFGGAGNDTLNGGAGADLLVGGAGADTFNFFSGQANGDLLRDFTPGVDHIDLFGYGAGATFTRAAGAWIVTDGALIERINFDGTTPSLAGTDFKFH
jgi:hypothetical protein